MTAEEINIACAERLGWKFQKEDDPIYRDRYIYRATFPNGRQAGKWVNDFHQLPGRLAQGDSSYFDSSDSLHGLTRVLLPNFHGSLDAAMTLVEKAKEMGWELNADNTHTEWRVSFVHRKSPAPKPNYVDAVHTSFSAAICEAFLRLPH